MNRTLTKKSPLKIIVPSIASLLCRFLSYLKLPQLSTSVYSNLFELNQSISSKQNLLIILTDPSFLPTSSESSQNHHYIFLTTEPNQKQNSRTQKLLLKTENQQDILIFLLLSLKTKPTEVIFDQSVSEAVRIKAEETCSHLGIPCNFSSAIKKQKSDKDTIIVIGQKQKASNFYSSQSELNHSFKVLVSKIPEDVERQLVMLIFHQQPDEQKLTILYERDNPLLEKNLVMLSAKCSRKDIIQLYQIKCSDVFRSNRQTVTITHTKKMYQQIRNLNAYAAEDLYLFALNQSSLTDRTIKPINLQQISDQISKYLSLSEIISTSMIIPQQTIVKQVSVIDAVRIKQVQDLCHQIGLSYKTSAFESQSFLKVKNKNSYLNRPIDTLSILILTQDTYTVSQLQEFKPQIENGKILTILIKSHKVPISPKISPYVSHTCQRSAVKLYLSTLINKYYTEPILKDQSTQLMNKDRQINPVGDRSELGDNETSIEYNLPHYSTIQTKPLMSTQIHAQTQTQTYDSLQNKNMTSMLPSQSHYNHKQIVLKQADIKCEDENSSQVIIFKQWQDLVYLYEFNKESIKQIKVVQGVWYQNMLGSFKSKITKYPSNHKMEIKSSITQVNINHFQQIHVFYEEELDHSVLEHILHVCQHKANFIPHNLESPYQIRNSIMNNQNYVYAFTASNSSKTYLNQIPSKGKNYLICCSTTPFEMHKVLFSILASNYSPINNVLDKLFDIQYQKMLRCVSQTTLQSQLLSFMSISRASSAKTNKQKDIIQKLNDIKKDDILYTLVPQQLLQQLTFNIGHLKRIHLFGYTNNLENQLLRRKKGNLKSLVVTNQDLRLIQSSIFSYPENIFICNQLHTSKLSYPNLFSIKFISKLISLLELSCKSKKVEQYSLNVSHSSVSYQPIVLFYKYPEQYSLKQLISTNCNRPIQLHAYSTLQSLLLNIKAVEANLPFDSAFIIVVLRDSDIDLMQNHLQEHHKVIRFYSQQFIGKQKIVRKKEVLIEVVKYQSILNYLKGDFIDEEIERDRFKQEKTVRVGMESSESSQSAITLGRHSSYESLRGMK